LSKDGQAPPEGLPAEWRIVPENPELKDYLLLTARRRDGSFDTRAEKRRPLPDEEYWFETVWHEYREGLIYT